MLMICPYCNAEMIKGNILGDRYSLKWMQDNEKLIFGAWAHNAITLGNKRGIIGRPRVEAFICHKCKKLIADL